MTRAVRPRTLRRLASRERQRGYLGLNSYRRLAASALSGPVFFSQLTTSIVPDKAAPGTAPTFTRATTKTFVDWEGRVRTALSGEACFTGARRVQNYLTNTILAGAVANTTAPTGWTRISAGGTFAPTPSALLASHNRLDFTVNNNREIMALTVNVVAGHTYVLSAYLEAIAGTFSDHVLHLVSGTGTVAGQPCSGALALAAGPGQRLTTLTVYSCSVSGTATFRIGLGCGSTETGNCSISLSGPMLEDVTSASNQNPSEYVSVGVLAAPYQGANVDGVQYFATQNGNTVASNVVKAGTGAAIGLAKNQSAYLPGATGAAFTVPDSAANSLTTSLDVDGYIAPAAWASSATQEIISKSDTDASNFSYLFRLEPTGALSLYISFDGTTLKSYTSTVTLPAGPNPANGTGLYVRVTWSGAAGTITFYYSSDGVSWTVLGAPSTNAAYVGTLFDGTATVKVGVRGAAFTGGVFKGVVYRARLYSGDRAAAPLVLDFNPQDYTTGSTWASSTTGETWTTNGGATILNFPLLGYSAWQQSTNLVLQSENFGTTWTTVGTPTRSAAALRCGDVVLDLLSDADAGTLDGYTQTVTFTGDAVKAVSIHFAQGSATTSLVQLQDSTATVTRLSAVITWSGGVPTVTVGTGVLLGVDSLGNGVYRMRVATASLFAANTNVLKVFPASDAIGTVSLVGNAYFGGVQAENNTFATPYIATTTAAVTRNADVLQYPSAGNVLGTAGACYAEVASANLVNGARMVSVDGATNTFRALLEDSGGALGVYDGTTNRAFLGIAPSAAAQKFATSWGAATCNGAAAGVSGTAQAFDGDFNVDTNITIGTFANLGGLALNGNIRNVKIWNRALADAELVQATS